MFFSNTNRFMKRANLYGIAAILMWSTLIALVRTVSQAFGVAFGTALIFTSGAIILCVRQGIPKIFKMHPLYVWGSGLAFIAYELLFSQAIGFAKNSYQTQELAMINYLWPCLIVVFAIFINQEKIRWWGWFGTLFSFGGVFICLSSNGGMNISGFIDNIASNPLPYGMTFIAAILWAIYCNLSRKYGGGDNAIPFFLMVIATFLWIRFLVTGSEITIPDWKGFAQLAYVAVVFAISYTFWEIGIQKGNMILLAIISYFSPVFAMLFLCFWLQNIPQPTFWIGVVSIVIGSLICWKATPSTQN